MASPSKRNMSRKAHQHALATQNVGANLQRQVCGECGHISINPVTPAGLRAEISVSETGLFGGAPELVYELAEELALIPATDPDRPRFGERRRPVRNSA